MNTVERYLLILAAAAVLAVPLSARTEERRATFTGGGVHDTGKCTVEVYVDGAAEVEIRGDRASLRTLSGQPARWRRFECSERMPANPSELRFVGVDGRGRQELVQNPTGGRGVVVRIQDQNGGAEGYTFDLIWRGAGFGSTDQPYGGTNRRGSPEGAIQACQNAVRDRANERYGFRQIDFRNMNSNDPGRSETVMGSFDVRRDNFGETYDFTCAVDQGSGTVRRVDISQKQETGRADRYADRGVSATSACQRAAEQRMERDGYRNVQFGWQNGGNRRDVNITGTARAQRGNNGRTDDFEIRCSVDPNTGDVRSVQVKRR